MRAPATLRRRLAAMVYELLIVVAIAFLVGLAFVLAYAAVTGESGPLRIRGPGRLLLQISVLAALGTYFVWFWQLGRTLPMKTWDLHLTRSDGRPVGATSALVRFLVAAAAFVPALVGMLELRQRPGALLGWAALLPLLAAVGWIAIDRDRQALWDRIAGTRLVHAPRHRAKRAA
jgi:uncharacterized RDD family membrane protein YckC